VRCGLDTEWTPEKPLYGTVSGSSFVVQLTPRTGGRGTNPYFVREAFAPGARGTIIRATYGVDSSFWLLMGVIGAPLVLIFSLALMRNARASGGVIPFIACAVAVVLFAIWRFRTSTSFTDPQAEQIVQTVVELLDARVKEAA